ncbi:MULTISPECIES: hypothetical protein [Pseudoalteromonas]|uniref:hypothetical protein n=1 Tax=Pseudoalteromonas TaxID=53246 RepID=UPI0015832C16|nr:MULTISPECIES: hypothetical protein [Pseudoalteromonas]MDI4654245.1 hypothetical protein [Pseudoalteromonas shioyasakiensis]NUJ40199.1 hypothetical protein [Pseudoalteromonas sp. 0303]
MSIKTIKCHLIRAVWEFDDVSVFPLTYGYEIRDILFDLDAAGVIADLEDIGAINYNPEHEEAWSITVTVNNVEPCGAVTCDFFQGDCYNVDFKECNA